MTPCSSINRVIALVLFVTLGLVPTAFAVTAPVVSTLASITDGVRTPVRLALSQWGDIFVTDPRGGGLNKYSNAGARQKSIPLAVMPKGVAVDSIGNILVSQGTFVVVLDPTSGLPINRFGTFTMANGIAVDSAGTIYVVDSQENCVQVFDAKDAANVYKPHNTAAPAAGKPANSFGSAGNTTGHFFQPTGITYEKKYGQIAVVDTLNGRIQFFSPDGTYLKTVGAFGSGPLKFTSPQSIAFEYSADGSKLDRMYVVDTFQGNVQVIDASNAVTPSFLRSIGNYGMKSGNLVVPSDLLFDSSDSANKRLIVANGSGKLALYGITGGNSVSDNTNGGTTINTPSGPTLNIDSYSSYTNLTSLILSGTVSGGTVTVNGVPVVLDVNTINWTSAPLTLKIGSNIINVIATGASNSITSRSVTVNVIKQDPVLQPVVLLVDRITSPTTNSSPVLSGTVNPCSGVVGIPTVTVTVDGVGKTVTSNVWSLPVTLKSGTSTIVIKGSIAGCSDSQSDYNVTMDDTKPLLTVYTLSDGSTTSSPVQSISGAVIDASATTVSVKVNGVELPKVLVNDGVYSLPITLGLGVNTVAVTATDAVGNVSIDKPKYTQRNLTYEPQIPVITVEIPNGAVIAQPPPSAVVQYSFYTTAPADFTPIVTINDVDDPTKYTVTTDSSVGKIVAKTVALPDVLPVPKDVVWKVLVKSGFVAGLNKIEVKAINDISKNIVTETVAKTVNFSSELPTIAVITPAQDIVTASKNFTLVGAATPGSIVTALVNGSKTQVNQAASGAFSLSMTFQEAGSYAVILQADSNGSTSSSYRTLVYDNRVPKISYDKVANKYTATDGILYAKDSNGNFITNGIAGSGTNELTVSTYDGTLNVFALSAGGNSSRDGDLSRKGYVDISDALKSLRIQLGAQAVTNEDLFYGDIATANGISVLDNKIGLDDVITILHKAAGLPR